MSQQTSPDARVAIVLRTRNRPLLLARALDSILAQTYQDYVAVVVNDTGDRGPVEEAVARVADLARGRIHIVHNTVSRGREAAMNTGTQASSSTFVTIHDDDDTWAPRFLERTVEHLERTGQLAVATRTEVIFERIDGDVIITEGRELLATDKTQVALLDTIVRNYTPPISMLYRRDVLQSTGEYDESLPVLADWDFTLKLLRLGEVGFIDGEPLAFWHHRPAAQGAEKNSVHTGDDHARWDAIIRDRYLRADLAKHDGLGYLLFVSELLDRDRKVAQNRGDHIAGAVHEVHNSVAGLRELHSALADAVQHLYTSQDGLVRQLAELNRNLISQNNRMVAQFERLGERLERLEGLLAHSVADRLS